MKMLYLFTVFFRIDLFAIGGGFATLPFLFELADKSDWLTRESIGNMLAIAQSAPGAIGVNLSALIGFKYSGISGGLMAALGLVTPSIIVIIIAARMLETFRENKIIKILFTSLRPAAAGLLAAAGLGVIVLSFWNAAAPRWYEFLRWKEFLLFGLILFLVIKFKKHPVLYIAAAGAAGIILKL
jgi:chromate transporter